MIFIDRNKIEEPEILSDPTKVGVKETLAAIAYVNGGSSTDSYEYKAYRHPQVKEALIKLFHGKCAYCESTFLHVYSGDVEHFRPKGEIQEAAPNTKPGYYWLAANWNNLLLSCRNCNQKLTHALHGESVRRTMGKMNQFPLSDLTRYVRRHDHPLGIQDEEPFRLLLNPCVDNPEDHLEYGDQGVIKPKKDVYGNGSIKGIASINVYVLQRVPLVLSREKSLINILAQIQRVKEAVINYDDSLASTETIKTFYFEKILKRELERLHQFLKPEEPYVGMARQIIGGFLKENFNVIL